MTQITTDLIISTIKRWVEEKQQISPDVWIDGAMKLVVLIGDEHDKLFALQQKVASMKSAYISEGKSVAEAKVRIEAEDVYRDMQRQNAKIKQVEEMVRIAKIRARLKDNEYQMQ